ncbi:hypothetical protein [Mongoliibacter ruber]|uniref:DNA polymerase III psi subunit n=1 Tax=Mongoliibacter ruber TaxID=1750599 RepID=A0A2T0WKK1_9BACT|nr:hypothetical protein [Mongoliibacter ruber]PRY87182.1 hypothetical protein CLW00_107252 [Mongoliibacter ruber]
MENQSLYHLGMFLDQDIYLLPEEKSQILSKSPQNEVELETESLALDEEEAPVLEYEGGFEKGILVIFEGKELEKEFQDLLLKILNAVNCSLKDIALCSDMSLNLVNHDYLQEMNPNKIIVFGNIHHDLMGLKKKNYKIQHEEDTEYLFADDLKLIAQEVSLKKALWAELQVLFNITSK